MGHVTEERPVQQDLDVAGAALLPLGLLAGAVHAEQFGAQLQHRLLVNLAVGKLDQRQRDDRLVVRPARSSSSSSAAGSPSSPPVAAAAGGDAEARSTTPAGATVYRTLGSAEISIQHGPYGFRFGQLMFCRGVATDILLGAMNHRQCGQQTPKYPKIRKTANLIHFHLESEVNVSTSSISHCVKPVSPPPSSDADGQGK